MNTYRIVLPLSYPRSTKCWTKSFMQLPTLPITQADQEGSLENQLLFAFVKIILSPKYSTLEVCPHPVTLVSTPATLLLLPEVLKMFKRMMKMNKSSLISNHLLYTSLMVSAQQPSLLPLSCHTSSQSLHRSVYTHIITISFVDRFTKYGADGSICIKHFFW